jgi:hypothetical protein
MEKEEGTATAAANITSVVSHHDHILLLDSRDVLIPFFPISYCKYQYRRNKDDPVSLKTVKKKHTVTPSVKD